MRGINVQIIMLFLSLHGIITGILEDEFKAGIKLCAQRCFQNGCCLTIDSDSLYCSCRAVDGGLSGQSTLTVKLHPMIWKHSPGCDVYRQLIKSKSKGPVCLQGHETASSKIASSKSRTSVITPFTTPLSTTASTITALSTVVSTTTVLTTASATKELITASAITELTTASTPTTSTSMTQVTRSLAALTDSTPENEVSKGPKCKTIGMHYAPKQKKCLKGCRRFGKTMSTYKGTGLDAHNDKRISDLSLEECIQKCVTLTEFTCKSFDFGKDVDIPFLPYICYLSKVSYYDVPAKERNTGKSWTLGIRNCDD